MSGRRSLVAHTKCIRQLTNECMVLNSLRFVLVPQGRPRIAHPFKGGKQCLENPKPRRGERKRSVRPQSSSVPDGTRSVCARCPSDESLAYFRASLRDLDSDCSREVVNHSEL